MAAEVENRPPVEPAPEPAAAGAVEEVCVTNLIRYSEKYKDSQYEYRHVTLPEVISKKVRCGNKW